MNEIVARLAEGKVAQGEYCGLVLPLGKDCDSRMANLTFRVSHSKLTVCKVCRRGVWLLINLYRKLSFVINP